MARAARWCFVDDGRIAGVEAAGAVLPDGVELIDLPTGTVLPGLVNAHVHLCGDSENGALERLPEFTADHLQAVIDTALAQQLASGVTTVRDLGDDRWSVVDRRDRRGHEPRSAHRRLRSSHHLGRRALLDDGRRGGRASEALRAAVRERAERRVDIVKVMASGGNMTPGTDIAACQFTLDELRCVVEESHGLGLPVTAHAHALAAVEQAVEAGVDGIEHCTCLTEHGVELSEDLMRRLREREIVVCPTLGRARDAVMSPRIVEMLARFGMTFEGRQQLYAAVLAAGVQVISGDDAGITAGQAPRRLPRGRHRPGGRWCARHRRPDLGDVERGAGLRCG